MTKENRQFVSLDEIASIQLRCLRKDCGLTVSLPPSAWDKLENMLNCPGCGETWWLAERPLQKDSTEAVIESLQVSIRSLTERHKNRKDRDRFYLGCDLSLEIKTD